MSMSQNFSESSRENLFFQKMEKVRNRSGKVRDTVINLAHGSGGKAMSDLINDVFVSRFNNEFLSPLEDQAIFPLEILQSWGNKLAFTTDSYVVTPLFFPGSNIGELAVNGTVNDLAVSGAKPLFLSCSVILEEGFSVETLRTIIESMKCAADLAGVQIVTGDTKVVNRGCADQLFINTAGIGIIKSGVSMSAKNLKPGDIILSNGYLGDHGTAILLARGEFELETPIQSDCQALNGLVDLMLKICPEIHAMRDITRGGLGTILNEFALSSQVGIMIEENRLPVREEVRGVCEILGLDPLYLANEGKLVAVVPSAYSQKVLEAMKSHPCGQNSCKIGEVISSPPGIVLLQTELGTQRIVDRLVGEQLPRIC